MLTLLASDWSVQELPHRLFSGETAKKMLPATMGGGIAVFDFDNDGLLDIFVTNGAPLPAGNKSSPAHSNRLFRNLGKMKFEDVTAKAGLAGTQYSFGALAGDYDGDGLADLLVTELRGIRLYRNRGNGEFQDVTANSGLNNRERWAVGGAWLDYDNDGDLDLFVVNYVAWDAASEPECKTAGRIDFCHPRYYQPQPNALFRNDGGKFVDVSKQSGIDAHRGKGMAAGVADFNGDGRLDIFVSNDRVPSFLLQGSAAGTFAEIALEAGVSVPMDGKPVSGMGIDIQDFNNDGHPDLVYTALKDETFPIYRGSAAGFDDAAASTKLGPFSRRFAGWGIVFADLDNDGFRDVVAATSDALSGQVDPSRKGRIAWFRNAGGGRFEPAQEMLEPAMYRGIVAADLDRDGCLDLVVTALEAPTRIVRNPCLRTSGGAKREWLGSSSVGYASSLWEERPRQR